MITGSTIKYWSRVDAWRQQAMKWAEALPPQWDQEQAMLFSQRLAQLMKKKAIFDSTWRFLLQVYGLQGSRKLSRRQIVARLCGNRHLLVDGKTPSTDTRLTTGMHVAKILRAGRGRDQNRVLLRLEVDLLIGPAAGVTTKIDFGSSFDRLLAKVALESSRHYHEPWQLHGCVFGIEIQQVRPWIKTVVIEYPAALKHNSQLVRRRLRVNRPCPFEFVHDCGQCKATFQQCSLSPWEILPWPPS